MAEMIWPHNREVICDKQKCDSGGWNPPVAEQRIKSIVGAKSLYRIPFTGYCEVWANSLEEAAKTAEDIEKQFFAHYDYGDPVCLEKEESNE